MAEIFFVIGLGYGDEGKGSVVDFLTELSGSKFVVRYNGGPQAAHHVVRNGHTHCFSQFGSGTLANDSITYLSKHMLVDPLALAVEEEALRQIGTTDGFERLFIDGECLVITPMQKIVGQMRELSARYGSCGMGVGETVRDRQYLDGSSLTAADLQDSKSLQAKLDFLWRYKLDHAEQIADENPHHKEIQSGYERMKDTSLVKRLLDLYHGFGKKVNITSGFDLSGNVIFEGAQGVLLDVDYGFVPHVTKTKTTLDNAYDLIGDSQRVKRIGVLRAYGTRHGAGPFVSEDRQLTQEIPDIHNGMHKWQGKFRIGWLDVLASRYALEAIGGVDGIALTNLDRLLDINPVKVCTAYEYTGNEDIDKFFDYEIVNGRKIIHGIKIRDVPDEGKQRELTRLIFDCKPIYTEFSGAENDYLAFIESKLDTPIMIISKGPESKDKSILRGI